jgi:hypothetical protein
VRKIEYFLLHKFSPPDDVRLIASDDWCVSRVTDASPSHAMFAPIRLISPLTDLPKLLFSENT